MTRHLEAGDACMIRCPGLFDGMVVVLERRSPTCSALWKIVGRASASNGQSIGRVHSAWLVPLHESPGVDEIVLVRMARQGSGQAERVLAQRRADRARV